MRPAPPGAPAPGRATRVERLLEVLPQTQCTKCGHAGCRPYAEAIADGVAPINRCPPGGDATIAALSRLTGSPVQPLDPACGAAGPLRVAWIDPALCIGCTLCIRACPVDAIVGARGRMHRVLAADCTGCALCIAPCPMDCIALLDAGRAWASADASAARSRHEARARRLQREAQDRGMASAPPDATGPTAATASSPRPPAAHGAGPAVPCPPGDEAARAAAAAMAAVARARARRQRPPLT